MTYAQEFGQKKELVLFSTKELGKVLSMGMSTLYTSGAWSVCTYI